jgi:hypothetical protein
MRVLAYLDPGSGSVMLQALLGGVATVLVSIKMFGKRVYRALFFWRRHDDEDSEPAASTTTAAEHETEKEPV